MEQMTQLSNGERRIRLLALVAQLERLRIEANNIYSGNVAYLISMAEEETHRELDRLPATSALSVGR
jgi:hypothetical protein